MAVWALVCSIVGFCCCGFILGPIGIVLGYKAKNEGSTAGTATAAIVIGIIVTLLSVLAMILYFTGVLQPFMGMPGF